MAGARGPTLLSRDGSSPYWEPAMVEEYKARERGKAVAAMNRFYRCAKQDCSMNLLNLQPPTLQRQQAFCFKETVTATCPVCGDKDSVVIYY